jgi:hypothetical protein
MVINDINMSDHGPILISSGLQVKYKLHQLPEQYQRAVEERYHFEKSIIFLDVTQCSPIFRKSLPSPPQMAFENRVLRRIFGPKRDEVTGDWRKLHNEELHNLYSSPSIIRMNKSRRMRCTGHVARVDTKKNA